MVGLWGALLSLQPHFEMTPERHHFMALRSDTSSSLLRAGLTLLGLLKHPAWPARPGGHLKRRWGSLAYPRRRDSSVPRSLLTQVPLCLADTQRLLSPLRLSPSPSFSFPSVISLFALENQELAVKTSCRMLQAAVCDHLLFPLTPKGLIF